MSIVHAHVSIGMCYYLSEVLLTRKERERVKGRESKRERKGRKERGKKERSEKE